MRGHNLPLEGSHWKFSKNGEDALWASATPAAAAEVVEEGCGQTRRVHLGAHLLSAPSSRARRIAFTAPSSRARESTRLTTWTAKHPPGACSQLRTHVAWSNPAYYAQRSAKSTRAALRSAGPIARPTGPGSWRPAAHFVLALRGSRPLARPILERAPTRATAVTRRRPRPREGAADRGARRRRGHRRAPTEGPRPGERGGEKGSRHAARAPAPAARHHACAQTHRCALRSAVSQGGSAAPERRPCCPRTPTHCDEASCEFPAAPRGAARFLRGGEGGAGARGCNDRRDVPAPHSSKAPRSVALVSFRGPLYACGGHHRCTP